MMKYAIEGKPKEIISRKGKLTMDLNDAQHAAEGVLDRLGLKDQGWTFEWDTAPKRFGCCRHRDKTITLSTHLVKLNSLDQVWETILHEAAHALAGPGHGHDQHWWNISRQLGCTEGARHRAQTAPTYMLFSFEGD